MTGNAIILNWTKLTSIFEISLPKQDKCGVYIWGFSIENGFIPYYVGIADNIIFRIYQHINSIISGLYTIYHRDSLAKFKEFKNKDVNLDKLNGKIYSPNWPKGYKTFIKDRQILQEHIDFMVNCFTFSYATVDQKEISKKDLQKIEKICISQIGIENLANTRSGDSDRFNIEHCGDRIVINIMNNKPLTTRG